MEIKKENTYPTIIQEGTVFMRLGELYAFIPNDKSEIILYDRGNQVSIDGELLHKLFAFCYSSPTTKIEEEK